MLTSFTCWSYSLFLSCSFILVALPERFRWLHEAIEGAEHPYVEKRAGLFPEVAPFFAKFAVFYWHVVRGQRSRYLLHPFSYWRLQNSFGNSETVKSYCVLCGILDNSSWWSSEMADHFLFQLRKLFWIGSSYMSHVFLCSEVRPRCLKVATATSVTSVLTKLFNKTDELHYLSMEVTAEMLWVRDYRCMNHYFLLP